LAIFNEINNIFTSESDVTVMIVLIKKMTEDFILMKMKS